MEPVGHRHTCGLHMHWCTAMHARTLARVQTWKTGDLHEVCGSPECLCPSCSTSWMLPQGEQVEEHSLSALRSRGTDRRARVCSSLFPAHQVLLLPMKPKPFQNSKLSLRTRREERQVTRDVTSDFDQRGHCSERGKDTGAGCRRRHPQAHHSAGAVPLQNQRDGNGTRTKGRNAPCHGAHDPRPLLLQTERAQLAVPSSLRQLLLSRHRRRSCGNCPVRSFLQHT